MVGLELRQEVNLALLQAVVVCLAQRNLQRQKTFHVTHQLVGKTGVNGHHVLAGIFYYFVCTAPSMNYSEYSFSCGTTGVKSRTRSCIAPTEGGLACPEESTETENQHCETNPCCSTSVKVTDATSGDAIEGAQVTFTIGDEAAQTLDSGSDGTVALGSLEMQTGVAVKIQKQFYDDNNDAIVVGDSCGSPIDMPMNPQSIDGRIVLTWSSDAPKDLDVYMPSNQVLRKILRNSRAKNFNY